MEMTIVGTSIRRALLAAVVALSFVAAAGSVQAAPLQGNLNFTGSVIVTSPAMGSVIDWTPPCQIAYGAPAESCSAVGGTFGIFNVEDSSTQYFADLGNTEQDGVIQDFQQNPALPIANFLTFPGTTNPDLVFSLGTVFDCGDDPAAVAAGSCLAGLDSPFIFTTGLTGTTITIAIAGMVSDPTGADISPATYSGTFSADFPGLTPLQICDSASQGFIEAPYSAATLTIVPTTNIPEPATLLLLGTGSTLAAWGSRRRRAKAAKQNVV